MSKPETSPELMRAFQVLADLPPPPAAKTMACGADVGLRLLPEGSREEIRARMVALVDRALAEAAVSIVGGKLPSDFLEGAHVTLRFAP